MTLKQLTTGSIILMFIMIFISLGMNGAVERSLVSNSNNVVENSTADPTAIAKSEPLKAEVHKTGQNAANLIESDSQISFATDDNSKNPITKLVEKGIVKVYSIFNPSENQEASTSSSISSYNDYQAYLEQNPLSPEDEALLNKYTDKSPLELIQAYCEDAKTPEFKEMIDSIKSSYGNDPSSPAALMQMFESTAKLCP